MQEILTKPLCRSSFVVDVERVSVYNDKDTKS